MLTVARWVTVGVGALMVVGTLLSLSRSPHWLLRLWDFPRVQIALVAALSGVSYALVFLGGSAWEWAFLGAIGLCVAWQLRKIVPYTPLAPVQVERSRNERKGSSFRLIITNVRMENDRYDRLLEVIRDTDPDLVLAVEVDARWERALAPLTEKYPHTVRRPQDNYYGLFLLSRLPLIEPRVDFLVQDDVPSVHTGIELPSGERIMLYGLHPRPPEPIRGQDSTPRDAELVIVGRTIDETPDRPTVVVGDLNDVAWSHTTELFLRLSGLLDPRRGRGFFNSYNAESLFFRYPLDHVFHSDHFRLVDLRRLPAIGSDHFPMLVELSYEPEASHSQHAMEREGEDTDEARDRLEKQSEAAMTGDDRPSRE